MVQKPPSALPSQLLPLVDENRIVTEGWFGFFTNLTAPATPFYEIPILVPTPFTFVAIHAGDALIIGGTVIDVGLRRRRVIITPTGLIAGFFPMSQNDELIINFAVVPVLWFLPNGNPS